MAEFSDTEKRMLQGIWPLDLLEDPMRRPRVVSTAKEFLREVLVADHLGDFIVLPNGVKLLGLAEEEVMPPELTKALNSASSVQDLLKCFQADDTLLDKYKAHVQKKCSCYCCYCCYCYCTATATSATATATSVSIPLLLLLRLRLLPLPLLLLPLTLTLPVTLTSTNTSTNPNTNNCRDRDHCHLLLPPHCCSCCCNHCFSCHIFHHRYCYHCCSSHGFCYLLPR
ncbi:Slc47a1 [Symbiodinium sp. CCMP2592]|nr:Slc47a1 [Symbiodinium sp. CCMP2592]